MPIWLICCYGLILLCAVIGNLLVVLTLVRSRRMRTFTNVFLLNLAISDILLGVLCMPVTLVGTLLRHFIFGEFLCKLLQFSQAISVAVSSWTLVAISCERYYAICHPLRSRTWQTINHAYKIIGFIWIGSFICMTPIAVFSQLMPTSRQGYRKCRENWPTHALGYERLYNLLLDVVLLVLPLLVLCATYILISHTLYVSIKNERAMNFGSSGYNALGGQLETVASVATPTPSSASTATTQTVRIFGYGPRKSSRNDGYSDAENTETEMPNEEAQQSYNLQEHQPPHYAQQHHQHQQQLHFYDEHPQSSNRRKLLTTLAPKEHRHLYCMHVKRRSTADTLVEGCGGTSPSPSMTVINVPQQQRFQLNQQRHQQHQHPQGFERRKIHSGFNLRAPAAVLRRSNETKNLASKKRVVKMLFVLVLEFFICWTPLYIINTVAMFIGPSIYEYIDYTSISFFQLLAYSSSCCNPITYCFMNASFRRAFLDTFKGLQFKGFHAWRKRQKKSTTFAITGNSLALVHSGATMTTILDSPRL